MPGGKRTETNKRKRCTRDSSKPQQGNETLQYSKHPKSRLEQRNIDALSVPCSTVTITSPVGSADSDLLIPGLSNCSRNNNVPCSSKESLDNQSQEICEKQLHDKDVATDNPDQTLEQPDDMCLLNVIESTHQLQALELLKEGHQFSKAVLNKALISACRHGYKCLIQTLVGLGAKVNFQDTNGNTPLLICAENGFTDIVRFLFLKKADASAVNSAGDNALILSIRSSGSKEIVRVLLFMPGININHQNRDGNTALMKAMEVMDIDVMKILLDKSNIQIVNNKGQTAQEYADKCGLGRIFRYFIKYKTTGMSPIVQAVEECDMESLNMLLSSQFLNLSDQMRSIKEGFIKVFSPINGQIKKTFNNNDILMVKKFLEFRVDVNTNVHGYSPLSVAVEAGNYRLINLLLDQGSHIKKQYEREIGPLQTAARKGLCHLIKLLLKYEDDVNQQDYIGSPLNFALLHGHIKCAKLLIQRGAKFDACFALQSAIINQTPEYMNFLFNTYEQEVKNFFLEHPYSVTDLLIKAVKAGNLEIIGRILDAGADINQLSATGVLPIVESKNREVAQFLVQRRANVSRTMRTGLYSNVTPVIGALLGRPRDNHTDDVIQVLLENGASVNGTGKLGRTALLLAAKRVGCVRLLKLFLDHGADLHHKDARGNTALTLAVHRGGLQNVSFFVNAGSDVNCQNNRGYSPLMLACLNNFKKDSHVLLDSGADINAVSKVDHTRTALTCLPLKSCITNKAVRLMKTFLERGASASYLRPRVLINVIVGRYTDVIPKMIRCGLRPADSPPCRPLALKTFGNSLGFNFSPLCTALLVGNVALARYFMRNIFLTNSDVSLLKRNTELRCYLIRKNYQECLDFLHEMCSQPFSLFTLSHLAVALALGTSPGHESRVNLLPLPQVLKDKLLFRTEEVSSLDKPETLVSSITRYLSDDDHVSVLKSEESNEDSNSRRGLYSPDYNDSDFD